MFGNGRHGKPRITGSGIGPAKKGKKIGGGFAEISGGAEVQVTIGDLPKPMKNSPGWRVAAFMRSGWLGA